MAHITDLPPELLVQILNLLSIPDQLLSCRAINQYFKSLVDESALLQYNAALEKGRMEDNLCSSTKLSSSEKLEHLKKAEAAWGLARPQWEVSIPVRHQQAGVYDLTGGVYVLSNSTKNAMHYLRLPRTREEGDKAQWKVIKVETTVIDIGLCIFEHDMIVMITTSPHRNDIHDSLTHDIHLDILQFSTGKPHPQAKNPHILVLNTEWEKPSVGIEIVGEHLMLVLSWHNGNRPDGRVSIYEWKTGLLKMTFNAPYRTYSGVLFLLEDLVLLPNSRINTLDIFRIPEKETIEIPKPVCRLCLPALSNGRHLGGISCRAEPNPIGKASLLGMTRPPSGVQEDEHAAGPSFENGMIGDSDDRKTNPSDPANAYLASAENAICLFELRILVLQMVFMQGGGVNMNFQFIHRFDFIVHRKALVELVAKHEIDKERLERERKQRKEQRQKEKEERDREKEKRKRQTEMETEEEKERANRTLEENNMIGNDLEEAGGVDVDVWSTSAATEDAGSATNIQPPMASTSSDINHDFDNGNAEYGSPPELATVSNTSDDDDYTSYSDESDDDSDSNSDADMEEPRLHSRSNRGIPYAQWGPDITRWFNSDNVATHWITTTAGEKCVRMPDREFELDVLGVEEIGGGGRDNGYPYTILDFNPIAVRAVKKQLDDKQRAEEKTKQMDLKGKGRDINGSNKDGKYESEKGWKKRKKGTSDDFDSDSSDIDDGQKHLRSALKKFLRHHRGHRKRSNIKGEKQKQKTPATTLRNLTTSHTSAGTSASRYETAWPSSSSIPLQATPSNTVISYVDRTASSSQEPDHAESPQDLVPTARPIEDSVEQDVHLEIQGLTSADDGDEWEDIWEHEGDDENDDMEDIDVALDIAHPLAYLEDDIEMTLDELEEGLDIEDVFGAGNNDNNDTDQEGDPRHGRDQDGNGNMDAADIDFLSDILDVPRDDIPEEFLIRRQRDIEAYVNTPAHRIRVQDQMTHVAPADAFVEPVLGGLPYVSVVSEGRYAFNGVLLDEERIIGVKSNGPGDIQTVDVLYFG